MGSEMCIRDRMCWGSSLHHVTVTTVRQPPPKNPDRNHGSRREVISSCCNYRTTTPPNTPDRSHGSRLEVISDRKYWCDSTVHVPTPTGSQARRLIVTYVPYESIPLSACTVTAFPDYEGRSRRRIACCSSGRDIRSLCPLPLL